MKKSKKILALIMSLVMMLSATSAGLVADAAISAKSTYTNTGLDLTNLNSVDEFNLTDSQYASMFLDFLDKMLGDMNLMHMTMSVASITLDINLTSLNGVASTLSQIEAAKDKLGSFLGDIADLDLSYFTYERVKDGSNDINYLQSFVSFLNNPTNAEAVGKVVAKGLGTGSGQLNPGSLVSNFLPSSVTDITDDIVGFIKEQLFGSKDAKFDTEVSTMIIDLIKSLDFAPLADFTSSVSGSDSVYILIDKAMRSVINWAIEQCKLGKDGDFGASVKDIILGFLPTFEQDYPFVNLDGFENLSWDWTAHGMGSAFSTTNSKTWFAYQINDMIGMIVENILPEFTSWTSDNSTSSLTTLDSNIAKLAQYANEKLNPNDTILEDGVTYSTKVYAMVLANFVIEMFLPSLNVSADDIRAGNICKLAVQALDEFMSYYLPGSVLSDLYITDDSGNYVLDANGHLQVSSTYTETYCKTVYKSQIAQIAAQFLSGYLPVTFTDTSSFDKVLYDAGSYFINTVAMGALGTVKSTETIYTAVDRILFSLNSSGTYVEGASTSGGANTGIMPKGMLPSAYNTTKKIVDQLFSCVENLSLGGLFKILIPNTSNTDMTTSLLPNLLSLTAIRVINKLFPGTYTSATTSLDTLITNENLSKILVSIMQKLTMSSHIKPLVKLADAMLGLSSVQSMGDAEVSLATKTTDSNSEIVYVSQEPTLYGTSTTLPSGFYINIENTTSGINSAYRNREGSAYRDQLYQMAIDEITCENVSTVTLTRDTASATAQAGSSVAYALSGTCPLGTTMRFVVKYRMSTETDGNWNPQQEARFYLYYGSRTTTTLTSNTVSVTVPTKVYASPNTLEDTLGAVKATTASNTYIAAADTSVAPTTLTNKGYKITFSAPGTPTSTTNEYFKMFGVTSSVKKSDYSTLCGTYSITYKITTKNTSDSESDYGTEKSTTISLLMFDDNGLVDLVNSYIGLDLQSGDYSDSTVYTAFMNELCKAYAMIYNPSSVGTTYAAIGSAFAAEVETLTSDYKALIACRSADKTAELKERIASYSTGTEDTLPLHRIYDYTPVSWARYSKTISTLKSDLSTGVTSALKITEDLRYNQLMHQRLVSYGANNIDKYRPVLGYSVENLRTVYTTYYTMFSNSTATYTSTSKKAMETALSNAELLLYDTASATVDSTLVSSYADARSAILAAANELIIQPLTVDGLEADVSSAQSLYSDNAPFTDEAWDAYTQVLEQAEDILIDPYTYIKDTSDEEVARGNARVAELQDMLAEAISTLENNPFISELKNTTDTLGNLGYIYGEDIETVVAGKYKFDIGETKYLVVPYGTTISQLSSLAGTVTGTPIISLTSNKSRYTDAEFTTPLSKSTIHRTASGTAVGTGTTKVRSNYVFRLTWENGQVDDYNIIVSNDLNYRNGAPTGSITAAIYATNMETAGTLLPQILDGTLAESDQVIERVLACDLNMDGKVDNTDLVLYKLYSQGKWSRSLV